MTGHRQKASREWKVGSIEQACHNPPQKQHRCVEEAATCRNTIMIVSTVSMLEVLSSAWGSCQYQHVTATCKSNFHKCMQSGFHMPLSPMDLSFRKTLQWHCAYVHPNTFRQADRALAPSHAGLLQNAKTCVAAGRTSPPESCREKRQKLYGGAMS